MCLYFALLVGFRFYLNRNIKDAIEMGILIISSILLFTVGKKALIYCIIVFVATVMQFDHDSLYASLLVFTISSFIKRKYLIPLTIVYHINVLIVVITSQNELNVNIVFFYSVCVIIFLLILFYPGYKQNPELKLKDDEKAILDELIKGKQLKEIDLYSKNTLTEKLKTACKRNNLIDKNELIFLYKWEQSQ